MTFLETTVVRGFAQRLTFGGNTLDVLSIVIGLVVVVGPVVLAAVALYWIIRLGVKHGLRSYELDKARATEPVV